VPVDGRIARGERTRAAIVEAFLDLLSEGVDQPRARQIAARAGVSVRTIFQHFDDLEGLRSDVVAAQAERLAPFFEDLDSTGELPGRIAALATRRAELFEFISPVRRAIETAGRSETFDRGRRQLDRRLRAQLEAQFPAELAAMERSERAARLAAADALCSYAAWDHLRRAQGKSVLQARRALVEALGALLVR
jgi:AcrR family transcriptional regulator